MTVDKKGGDRCFYKTNNNTFVESWGEPPIKGTSYAEKVSTGSSQEYYGVASEIIKVILSYNKNLMRRIYGRSSRKKETNMA